MTRINCLLILLALQPGILHAQEGALDQPSTSAGEALSLDEIKIARDAGVLSARAHDEPLWRLPLLTPRQTEDKGEHIQGPLRTGDAVFVCAGTALLEVDARTGRVRRRLQMPGSCTTLSATDGGVRVTAGSDERPRWSRSWELGPQRGTIPFFAFGQGGPGLGLFDRIQARRVELREGAAARAEQAADPNTRAALAAAVSDLEQLERLDRTNPWYAWFRGDYLKLLGREAEANAAFQAVLGFEPASDCQLAGLATRLDRIDPVLGDAAWRRGMACLLARGHEAELVTGLLVPMVVLGKPERDDLDPTDDADWATLVRRADRLLDLSPAPEASATFWTAMAQAAETRGLADAAKRYRGLAAQAMPNASFAPAGPGIRYLGYWLNALFALMLVLFFGLLIKLLRTFSARFSTPAGALRRFNPFTRWTAGELVGLVFGAPVLAWLLMRIALGVIMIGNLAAMPLSAGSGNLGDPAVVAWLDDMDPPEYTGDPLPTGARFIKALALQQAGELDRAEALYRGLPLPQAKVNLGVLLVAKGDRVAAEAQWAAALKMDPGQAEAAHNLGRPATSVRVQRAARYDLGIPLLAMPTVEMWDALWRADVERSAGGWLDPFTAVEISGDGLSGPASNSPSVPSALVLLLLIGAALGLLALVTRFGQPPLQPQTGGRIGWWLGWLLPGAARQYGPLWPAAGGLFAFVLIGAVTMGATGGQASNILDAIAMPAFNKYYGLAAAPPDPTRALLDGLASWIWVAVVFGLHLVYMGIAEKLRPDPAGPFRRGGRSVAAKDGGEGDVTS